MSFRVVEHGGKWEDVQSAITPKAPSKKGNRTEKKKTDEPLMDFAKFGSCWGSLLCRVLTGQGLRGLSGKDKEVVQQALMEKMRTQMNNVQSGRLGVRTPVEAETPGCFHFIPLPAS